MIFGEIAVSAAQGAILAHAQRVTEGRIAKGTRLSVDDLARLEAAGIARIVAAVLEPGDLTEDEAAGRIALSAAGAHVEAGPAGTGRMNLFSEVAGLFVPDRSLVDAVNRVDPGVTLATIKAFEPVLPGAMVATVKIIPLAVPGCAAEAAQEILSNRPAFRVEPYRARRVGLIQTELPGTKRQVLDKTARVLADRLVASGSTIVAEARCAHRAEALAQAISGMAEAEMIVIFGASAVIDARDVIPAAIEAAGGTVLHLGMPVDPGNLLALGEIGGRPIVGAPGCARSPKENGFDWVINRLLADIDVSPEVIRGMGVGGLLMEIPTRPSPRLTRGQERGG